MAEPDDRAIDMAYIAGATPHPSRWVATEIGLAVECGDDYDPDFRNGPIEYAFIPGGEGLALGADAAFRNRAYIDRAALRFHQVVGERDALAARVAELEAKIARQRQHVAALESANTVRKKKPGDGRCARYIAGLKAEREALRVERDLARQDVGDLRATLSDAYPWFAPNGEGHVLLRARYIEERGTDAPLDRAWFDWCDARRQQLAAAVAGHKVDAVADAQRAFDRRAAVEAVLAACGEDGMPAPRISLTDFGRIVQALRAAYTD